MKNALILFTAMVMSPLLMAQSQSADTIVVELAKSSKLTFTMQDSSDIQLLKNYDFQQLFDDMLDQLEGKETSDLNEDTTANEPAAEPMPRQKYSDMEENEDEEEENEKDQYLDTHHHTTTHAFNIDFGMNNYLEHGSFPDANGEQYTVRPWGSWNIALNSIQRTQIGEKFFLEWGGGISWYNFKFQDDNTIIVNGEDGVIFTSDQRDLDYEKSKLEVTYLNASLIPMYVSGGNQHSHFWHTYNRGFRFGAGPYIGYRIESHSKLQYREDGDKEVDKEKDDFYLNNLRYGIRMQIGIGYTDFFFNYDLNTLFTKGKGPELHPISFGIIF